MKVWRCWRLGHMVFFCSEYFLATSNTSCDEACLNRSSTCDVDALVSAAASLTKCLELIEDLGMVPENGVESTADNSGCAFYPAAGANSQSSYQIMKKVGGNAVCGDVTTDPSGMRVCACQGLRPILPSAHSNGLLGCKEGLRVGTNSLEHFSSQEGGKFSLEK